MAQLIFAGALAHTAQMVRTPHKLDAAQRHAVFGALDTMRQRLVDSRPDLLVIFGSDHFQSFHLDNMPAFCIGIGSHTETFGDAGVPAASFDMHDSFCRFLAGYLLDAGIDVATSRRLKLDHAFASPLHFLLPEANIPLVPVMVNTIAAPLAPLRRAHQLGTAVGRAIATFSDDLRVAVLGTGGLSHWLPIPDPDRPQNPSDAEIIEQMISGRDNPGRMQELLLPRINRMSEMNNARIGEQFDREVIDLLVSGRGAELALRTTQWVEENGGGGGQEIRNWLAAAGAAGDCKAELLSYQAVVPWMTGIALMEWQLPA
jgi:2,3-dihydroxyphenylpropionate 1,2-dioxygenase